MDVIWNPTKTNTSPIQEVKVPSKCRIDIFAHVEKAIRIKENLIGGFKDFLFSPPKIGEDSQFDEHIFQRG